MTRRPSNAWRPMQIVYRGKCSRRHGGCGKALSLGSPAWGLPPDSKRARWYFVCADCGALQLHDWAEEFAAKFPTDARMRQLPPGDRT